MRPGERPTEQLAKALEGDPATSATTVDAFITRHPPAERVLVFVDQFEELFTLTSAEERQRFITTLRALRAEPRCYLLLALRADFYGELMDSALWSAWHHLPALRRATLLFQHLVAPTWAPTFLTAERASRGYAEHVE